MKTPANASFFGLLAPTAAPSGRAAAGERLQWNSWFSWWRSRVPSVEPARPIADDPWETRLRPLAEADDPTAKLVAAMLRDGRHALLLRPEIAASLAPDQLAAARDMLDERMAMAPATVVALRSRAAEAAGDTGRDDERLFSVEGLLVDRLATTNAEYHRFVAAGGYADASFWDEQAWPILGELVDSTGAPGPRGWRHGAPEKERLDHPVVGVNWFEATAFARWVGKRLPNDAEWVRAAAWPVATGSGRPIQRRFPWGDSMDRERANLWGCRENSTVPASDYPEGATPAGALQMIGNVWEWTTDDFGALDAPADRLDSETPLKSLRGGAFDTYFEAQATCQFQSGDNPLARKPNIGFRCVVPVDAVAAFAADST